MVAAALSIAWGAAVVRIDALWFAVPAMILEKLKAIFPPESQESVASLEFFTAWITAFLPLLIAVSSLLFRHYRSGGVDRAA
ncbi:hypothetical protein [Uliginosibacterium sp. 31-12]|uniref:hypothetical protein n=1 Tax=Uliginosibacterium sp. 31-12 TaxID=3062781 RepID=UPI0026E389CF|nr:hypothetical protein [Uliginosibacterium sp. 31-12]MDO6388473.1 hypothetical protein [Uliginosibacterium sp. 31-12]